MTHNISRRTLAKGAAWSAPVVAATAAVPAYAASPICPDDINQKVQAQFDTYAAALPDLSHVTFRFYWQSNTSGNGSVHLSNLHGAFTGASEWDLARFPYGFEFAQWNVGTSPAVDNIFSGQSGMGSQGNVTFPEVYPLHCHWNKANGSVYTQYAAPVYTNNPNLNQRNVSHATGYFDVYNRETYASLATGGFGPATGTPQDGTHLAWTFAINSSAAKDLAKGEYYNLLNSHWADGTVAGEGAIYTATGLRPVGFLPPSLETVKNAVDPRGEYSEGCVEVAYALAVDNWMASTKRLAGLNIVYAQWGNGTVEDLAYSGTGYVWSHEVGAFEAAETQKGTTLGSSAQGTSSMEAINKYGSGVMNYGDIYLTMYGYQLRYIDGIW